MNVRTSRRRGVLYGLAATMVAFGLPAQPAYAMEIAEFDKMTKPDQGRYLTILVERSKKFLENQGKSDMARQITAAFNVVDPTSGVSSGLRQFDKDLEAARLYQQSRGRTLHVEHALRLTFSKLKIDGVPQAEMMQFGDGFKPSTTGSK